MNENMNPESGGLAPQQPEPLQPPYGYTPANQPVVSLPGSDAATPAVPVAPPAPQPPIVPLPPVLPPMGSTVERPVSLDQPAPGTPESHTQYQRFADEAGKHFSEAADAIRRGEFISESVVDPSADKDDRLVGLLSYVVPVLLPLIVLFSQSSARRPFQRYHAVQSLGLSGMIVVGSIALSVLIGVLQIIPVLGSIVGALLFCLSPIVFLMLLVAVIYYGAQAYQGKRFAIPLVTNFLVNQGWL